MSTPRQKSGAPRRLYNKIPAPQTIPATQIRTLYQPQSNTAPPYPLRTRHDGAILAHESGDFDMDLFGGELDRNMPMMSADAVGRALKAAREQLGLSLGDVARETRIGERHLEALEEGRFDGFAAPVYALGFARNYARIVGLPLQWITDCLRGEIFASFDARRRFDLGWTAEGLQRAR